MLNWYFVLKRGGQAEENNCPSELQVKDDVKRGAGVGVGGGGGGCHASTNWRGDRYIH